MGGSGEVPDLEGAVSIAADDEWWLQKKEKKKYERDGPRPPSCPGQSGRAETALHAKGGWGGETCESGTVFSLGWSLPHPFVGWGDPYLPH